MKINSYAHTLSVVSIQFDPDDDACQVKRLLWIMYPRLRFIEVDFYIRGILCVYLGNKPLRANFIVQNLTKKPKIISEKM